MVALVLKRAQRPISGQANAGGPRGSRVGAIATRATSGSTWETGEQGETLCDDAGNVGVCGTATTDAAAPNGQTPRPSCWTGFPRWPDRPGMSMPGIDMSKSDMSRPDTTASTWNVAGAKAGQSMTPPGLGMKPSGINARLISAASRGTATHGLSLRRLDIRFFTALA
jgi:hypothetical protein